MKLNQKKSDNLFLTAQELIPGGTIIINTDSFTKKNLKFADYETSPVEDGTLDDYLSLIHI